MISSGRSLALQIGLLSVTKGGLAVTILSARCGFNAPSAARRTAREVFMRLHIVRSSSVNAAIAWMICAGHWSRDRPRSTVSPLAEIGAIMQKGDEVSRLQEDDKEACSISMARSRGSRADCLTYLLLRALETMAIYTSSRLLYILQIYRSAA